MLGIIVLLVAIAAILFFVLRSSYRQKKRVKAYQLPENADKLLTNFVSFYRLLSNEDKKIFIERVRDFLARTTITPVGDTVLEDLDLMLIGASAIIPIFAFPDWRYKNIQEVLVYNSTFNKGEFGIDGSYQSLLGMVGSGALQGKMLLTKQSLRRGFAIPKDGHNTALHEFIHLIDKADGATDGVPEYLLDKPYIAPWIKYMHEETKRIRMGMSDINPYAAANTAEFLAVISEYFFERPHQLKAHHPELYEILEHMFSPKPKKKKRTTSL